MRFSTITSTLLAALLLIFAIPAQAQEQLDTPEWRIDPGEVAWLSTAHTVRGGTINPATGHLLIPSREDPLSVQVLNPADGSAVGTLDVTGVAGGDFPLNKIAVTAAGEIYAANTTTAASEANPFKIYRWADEDSAPVLVYEGVPSANRYGDAFNVSGSGDDVVAYASGAGSNTNVAVFELGDDGFDEPRLITIAGNAAQVGIVKAAGEDSLWINNPVGGLLQKISLEDGTVGTVVPATLVHGYLGELAQFQIEDATYLAVGPGRHDEGTILESRVLILDVTDVENIEVVAETFRWGANDNRYAPGGFVTYDEANNFLIAGTTQNAIVAFSLDFLLPPPPPFEPIAFWSFDDTQIGDGEFGFVEGDFPMDADVGEGTLHIGGGDITALNDGVYQWVQAFSGTTLNAPEGVPSGGTISFQGGTGGDLNNGAWMQFELNTVGFEDVELSFAARGTNTGFNNNQVSYSLDGENFVDVGDTFDPRDGSNFNVYEFQFGDALDHQQTAYIRITFDGATGESGNNRIDNITITGTEAEAPITEELLDEPEWLIAAGDVPWLQTGNEMRGGAYNPATDHVLVASRAGGLAVHILHPNNGQVIGGLDVSGIEGGTLPLSEVAVTEDGQIFGANLIEHGDGLRIYYWEDEDAAPQMIFDDFLFSEPQARWGDALAVGGSGDDVRVYLSGTFNENVAIMTWDGESLSDPVMYSAEEEVARARLGITEAWDGETYWINGGGFELAEIDLEDGTVLREIPSSLLPTSFGDIAYFELDGREYILAGSVDGTTNVFVVVDVTEPGEEFVRYRTMVLGENPNDFLVGWAAFDTKRSNILTGSSNNAVAAFSIGAYENQAPNVAELLTPEDAAEFTIEGDADTSLDVTWNPATDPDGDTVIYTWQASTTADFEDPVLEMVGTSTSASVDYAALAALLDELETGFGGSLTLHHRVVASDGAVDVAGEARTVTLIRGRLTNTEGGTGLPREFALKGNYPNPFNPTTNISFDLPESAEVEVDVFDILGRRVMTVAPQAYQAGANLTIQVDASALASGTYFYRVRAAMASETRIESGKMMLVK